MVGGSDVFVYSCGFGFALGWLTCHGSNFQVFAPTDVLMSISLTNIRAVASSTRITVNNVRLKGRWLKSTTHGWTRSGLNAKRTIAERCGNWLIGRVSLNKYRQPDSNRLVFIAISRTFSNLSKLPIIRWSPTFKERFQPTSRITHWMHPFQWRKLMMPSLM